jgi:hypothetical protein
MFAPAIISLPGDAISSQKPAMFRLLSLLSLLLFAGSAGPQELDPLLAPHANKYGEEIRALQAARKAHMTQVTTAYLQHLDAAIKAAAQDAATQAILKKERDGVASGLLAPAYPVGLPEETAAARKAFFAGVGKAAHDFATAKKKLDEAYLKVLAGLAKQAKAKTAPPGLAAQVAAEKRRVNAR